MTLGLYIITFPSIDLSYGDGIDSPLPWLYNHLLRYDFQSTKNILFPHGPLAFLTYPLVNGLKLFFFVDFSLKLLFVTLVHVINQKIHKTPQWFYIFISSYIFFTLSGIINIIIFDILLTFLIANETDKSKFKYLGFFLISIAFYIKSYSCSIAVILGFSYLIYNLILTRKIKPFILDILSLFTFILLVWLLLYHNFSGFLKYCFGIYNLVQDNSSAVSIYQENNWGYLIPFLLISLFLPWINFTKRSILYGSLTSLVIFAAFKHGMARQDINHTLGLFVFILQNFILFLLYCRSRSWLNIILSTTALCLFYINLNYKGNYFIPQKYEPLTINNFINFSSNYESQKQNAETETMNRISYRKFSDSLRDAIANSTIDSYPWDYSIIAINEFKWHPRPVIHSYASYTNWLDKQNAEYFHSKQAPDFLIWDFSKGINKNVNEGSMSSIDGRHILNDEPQTILSILSNYQFKSYENNMNLYKKRKVNIPYMVSESPLEHKKMNEWITVPNIEKHDISRIKVSFKKSITQLLKSIFYKDEQYWMIVKLSDMSIDKYRIIPKNAEDGIWLNPYVFNPHKNSKSLSIEQIMFTASNKTILNDNIDVTFENIKFDSQQFSSNKYVTDFFPLTLLTSDSIYFRNSISFDDSNNDYDITWNEQNTSNNEGLNKSKSFNLKEQSFSPTFEVPLNQFKHKEIDIKSTCWINPISNHYINKLSYVIAILDSNENIIEWHATNLSEQILNQNSWNLCTDYLNYTYTNNINKIKVFIWNTSDKEIHLEDFSLTIKGTN